MEKPNFEIKVNEQCKDCPFVHEMGAKIKKNEELWEKDSAPNTSDDECDLSQQVLPPIDKVLTDHYVRSLRLGQQACQGMEKKPSWLAKRLLFIKQRPAEACKSPKVNPLTHNVL